MHIGLIMDGNGRWAQARNLPRVTGHLEGLKAARKVVCYASSSLIDYLTLYVFSTENWNRPKIEVEYLIKLLTNRLIAEVSNFNEHGIKILLRGNIDALDEILKAPLLKTVEETKNNKALTLSLAINYGGQDEIVRATNKFIQKNPSKTITIDDITKNLDLHEQVPPVDLIVRSAGENRLSNFLLFESAYAEFLCIDKLWPDWSGKEIDYILEIYKNRHRSFGQIK